MNNKYLVVYGFNTKQWWIYDEDDDKYIDPPLSVLNEICEKSDDVNVQENLLTDIVLGNPTWLNDYGYRYYDIEI